MNAPAVRTALLAVTDARTGIAHLVTDQAMTAGRPTGRFVGVCGRQVLAASRSGAWPLQVLPPLEGRPVKLTGPDPEFPTTEPLETKTLFSTIETPAGRRSSDPRPPAPGGQPDPPDPSPASGPALRWARDPHDGRLHTVASVDALLAESRGYTECLCGHYLPADVGLEDGPSGLLCLPCVIGFSADLPDPGRMGAL